MGGRMVEYIRKNKVYLILLIVAVLLFLINAAIYYPGFMSADSISQLAQAKGIQEVTDWHPPVMVLVWKALIALTGHVSSMLLFQLALLWVSLTLLAGYLFKTTHLKYLAVLPLIVGILPFILNISGVVWKDCQMTFSLLLAAVLVLFLKVGNLSSKVRLITIIITTLLIIYACMVRYNAFFAAFPLLYLIFHYCTSWRLRWKTLGSIGVLVAVIPLSMFINGAMHVRTAHPISGVMADDIINTLSQNDITTTDVGGDVKQVFIRAIKRCQNKTVVFNTNWHCMEGGDRLNLAYNHYNEVKSMWTYMVFHKPWQYIGFRLQAFAIFLFAPDKYSYYWQNGIDKNNLDETVKYKELGNAIEVYVKNFGYKHFSFLFQAWFWLVGGAVALWYSRRLKRFRLYVMALSLSAILYIISYAPVVIGVDYRYIYWSVFATLLSIGMMLLEKYQDRNITTRHIK